MATRKSTTKTNVTKSNRGGKRANAGRNSKYGEETVTLRVPATMAHVLKKYLENATKGQRDEFVENTLKPETKRIFDANL